ncbi:MAG TPA: sulfate ABC transporter permease subunit CysW [Terriglobales bacterium]|jgi:sulfate transport system permease protein
MSTAGITVRAIPGAADPAWARWLLTGAVVLFLAVFLLLPLAVVFGTALASGLHAYLGSLRDPETQAAIRLTLLAAGIAVPLNAAFGLAGAWLIGKFEFPGKRLVTGLIELPLSISPVVAGLMIVLLFGAQGWWGPWLAAHNLSVVFAVPGIVLATIFVTFPYVARELAPALAAAGNDEEEAALTLGASGWQVLFRVTLPKVKWALLYGVILCNARAMGEFGAVSVVSGHIRGLTDTMPLQIEALYDDYQFTAAFAVASLLVLLALASLIIKVWLESREGSQ